MKKSHSWRRSARVLLHFLLSVLSLGLKPACLERGTCGVAVYGERIVMARRRKWDSRYQLAADRMIEGIPFRHRWPTVVSRVASTRRLRSSGLEDRSRVLRGSRSRRQY